MRLIDADKLKEYILKEGFYCDTKADKEATAKEIDSLFPTIEAIPIKWLEKRASMCIGDFYKALTYAIEDWKYEQKHMVNGRWVFPKEMKEMIYTKERKREWLLHDYYHGIEFVIMSLGTHPTAYIGVEKDNPYWLSNGDSLESCNGGITYTNNFIYDEEGNEYKNEKWWLGWDYSHFWDYTTLFNEAFGLKKWTTEEILEEVKATIDEILGEENEDNI